MDILYFYTMNLILFGVRSFYRVFFIEHWQCDNEVSYRGKILTQYTFL